MIQPYLASGDFKVTSRVKLKIRQFACCSGEMMQPSPVSRYIMISK
jgi:hypothetical protein